MSNQVELDQAQLVEFRSDLLQDQLSEDDLAAVVEFIKAYPESALTEALRTIGDLKAENAKLQSDNAALRSNAPKPVDPWRNVYITPDNHDLFYNAMIALGEPFESALAKAADLVRVLRKQIRESEDYRERALKAEGRVAWLEGQVRGGVSRKKR